VYTATAGGGAVVDGMPLHVSTMDTPSRALIGTGFPFKGEAYAAQYLAQLEALMPHTAGMRRAGSAALDLADLARGRFEAFWELHLHAWDVAAGILLVREAGGRVTDLRGDDAPLRHGDIVASNGLLHDWLLERLASPAPRA
jgi:myo-inositol-1(or 4)-monophosphatase